MTIRPRILVAGASVRWAAQSSRHAGFHVVGADLFGDVDTRAACEHFVLLDRDTTSDSTVRLKLLQEIAAKHDSRLIQVGGFSSSGASNTEASTAAANLVELQSLASRCGFSVPETRFQTVASSSEDELRGRWLAKTFGSSGGLGVCEAAQQSLGQIGAAYRQQRVIGRPYGLVALAANGQVSLLGMTRGLTHRSSHYRFLYGGSAGPIQVPQELQSRMHQMATLVARSQKLRGLFNLDWLCDMRGQWWFIELNSRPSASCEVLERNAWATGKLDPSNSLMGLHTAAIFKNGNRSMIPQDLEPTDPIVFKKIVYSRCSGIWKFDRVEKTLADLATSSGTMIQLVDRPLDGTRIGYGHPIATLIYQPNNGKQQIWASFRRAIRLVEYGVEVAAI